MDSVGARLRQERESRGRTIEEVAEASGIGAPYLEALEQNDWNALPGRAFGKLYIRAYAEVLQFEPASFIEAYDREQRLVPEAPGRTGRWKPPAAAEPELPEPVEDAGTPAGSRPDRSLAVMVIVAVIAIASALGFGLHRAKSIRHEPVPEPEHPAAAMDPTPEPAPSPEASPLPSPVAAPPRPPVAEAPQPPGSLSVTESGIGRKVAGGRVEEPRDSFAPGEAAAFATRVLGGRRGEKIRHVWIFEGRAQQSIPLRLEGPDFRTYSRKTLYARGRWRVEARDEAGTVLASAEFTCGPAAR